MRARRSISRLAHFALATPLLALTPLAIAQGAGEAADAAARIEPSVKFNASLNLNSAYTFSHGHDADGDVSTFNAGLNLVFLATLDETKRLIFTYNTSYASYDFSGGGTSPFADPWDDVIGLSLGVRYIQRVAPKWDVLGGLSATSDREIGAEFSDSLALNGFAGARYAFSDSLTLGLGIAVITQLEDDPTIFPIPFVEWKFIEGWSLSTVSSPIGGALEYMAKDQSYSVALAAGYESHNFRLDSLGVAPEGAATDRRVLVSLEGTLNISQQFSIGAIVGVNVWQELKIEDDNGNDIASTDTDPAAFLQINAAFRF